MSDGLRQRVVTALILLVALITLTLLTTPLTFAAAVAVIVVLAAWEWSALARLGGVASRLLYTLTVFVSLLGAAALCCFWSSAGAFVLFRVILILCSGVVWWCLAAFLLAGYPGNSADWDHRAIIGLMGLL
ncbi:MAG: phosphatidate cytidylyltransferase, partial [Pseudohongiellaceae bacterium]